MVAIGSLFGRSGAVIGLGLGLAIVGFSYWNSDALAIRAAHAVPADETSHPQYFAVMRELAAKARMPMPCLYVSPEPQPNRVRHRPQPPTRGGCHHRGARGCLHVG
jgi:heat shock protein HtpX